MTKKELYNFIKTARIDKGYSQQQVGEKMGKFQTGISDIEGGKRNLTVDNLLKFGKILDFDVVLKRK